MNKNLEEKLFNEFDFFKPRKSPKESLMCFGFSCDNGWYDLIYELCEKIKKENIEHFEVMQVKEKFGTLRFYAQGSTDKVFDFIQEAGKKSAETCEICGEKGSICEIRHWYKTLCKKCKKTK